jgi:uncharacterized protein YndB with AHSA1/START domain
VTEPLRLDFTVACAPEHAFSTWATGTSSWWPPGHSVSGEPSLEVRFEPHAGGRIYERTPAGEEHDWGQVLTWEPPRRLAYSWHLRQDRADATRVEITFAPDPQGTLVSIVHAGWERLGERAAGLRDRNRKGWGGLIPHFVAAAEAESPG